MKIAEKVIEERIEILNSYIQKNENSNDPTILMNMSSAIYTKDLFEKLNKSIIENNYEEISELLPDTILRLIQRNKELLEKYDNIILNLNDQDKNEYQKVKEDVLSYLKEYEEALNEIQTLVENTKNIDYLHDYYYNNEEEDV